MTAKNIDYDTLVARIDLPVLHDLMAQVEKTLGEVPCRRLDYKMTKCGKPKAHETCRHCFMWRDCKDPACDHPACGHGPASRWTGRFEEMYPDLKWVEVHLDRRNIRPLIDGGRIRVLLDEGHTRDEKAGKKLYAGLQRTRAWTNPTDVRGITGENALGAKLWLAEQGAPVEVSEARESFACWVAHDLVLGVDSRERARRPEWSGYALELRLMEAVADRLDVAPDLTQGALF